MQQPTTLFTPKGRMSDLLMSYPALLTMLPRMGIPLCIGNRSIDQVCHDSGVDTQFFLLICQAYTSPHFIPPLDQLLATDMSGLVPYLQRSHHFYLHKCLPHIEHHLQHIAHHLPVAVGQVLMRFFDNYQAQVLAHFEREEHEVFPHILALQAGHHSSGTTITRRRCSSRRHTGINNQLDDLLQILFKYLPASTAATTDVPDVVLDLLQLSHDIKQHAVVEEQILTPLVQHLEQQNAIAATASLSSPS